MILLDTNVVSGLMRETRDPIVDRWINRVPAESVWTTAINVFEVFLGIELLASSRRRQQLESAFASALENEFAGRVVSFDQNAARAAGRIAAERQRAGRPLEVRDLQIAGIATARRAAIATRNLRHFEGLGLTLIDPWAP